MSQKSPAEASSGQKVIRDIRRATRRQYSAEEKIRIVLDGLRGENSIAALGRREGIAESLYYSCRRISSRPGRSGYSKLNDLIMSLKFIVIQAADTSTRKPQRPISFGTPISLEGHRLGCFYLSTVLDDFSRCIIAWKLCATMAATDVTDRLELALQASEVEQAHVHQKPRATDRGFLSFTTTVGATMRASTILHLPTSTPDAAPSF